MAISKVRFIFVALVAIMLLMTACGSNAANSNSPTTLQVLQKSAAAMKHLQSAHIDIQLTGTTSSASTTPATTPSAASQTTIHLTGSGDEVLPDKFALHIAVGQAGQGASNTNLAEIILGRQLFIQNATGQWYVLRGGRVQGSSSNPFAGTTISNYNSLLTLAQQAHISDHGDQPLNGQQLRHLTVTFGEDALKALLTATGQISPQQDSSKLLSEITLQQSTLDLWIDEATSYVHRLQLQLHLTLKADSAPNSGTPATAPAPVLTGVDTLIDYSKFNVPITISAPAAAIPTDNPFSPASRATS